MKRHIVGMSKMQQSQHIMMSLDKWLHCGRQAAESVPCHTLWCCGNLANDLSTNRT